MKMFRKAIVLMSVLSITVGLAFAGGFARLVNEGDGIALAPITGMFMADLVCARTPEFDTAPFCVERAMASVGARR